MGFQTNLVKLCDEKGLDFGENAIVGKITTKYLQIIKSHVNELESRERKPKRR